jgi:hypothetical protein
LRIAKNRNQTSIMKLRNRILEISGILAFLFFYGCSSPEEGKEKEPDVKVPVTVTGIETGSITDFLEMTGTSAFLNKSVIQAPTSAYIEEIIITPGDFVRKGQILLSIKTKEAAAFQYDSLNPLQFSGTIKIRAAIDGIITTVNHPKGDFVMEGEPLMTIAVPGSFVFLLEVPYEMKPGLPINSNCVIQLPDGKEIPATVKSRLPVISGNSQTQKYIVVPDAALTLPENLIARIRIARKIILKAVILPKSAILTDEVMKNFWVMKLINDSVAVRIPVTTGLSDSENVEITQPGFAATDRFLVTGNYGLGDTAKVIVVKEIKK